jgi:hypothetical protein
MSSSNQNPNSASEGSKPPSNPLNSNSQASASSNHNPNPHHQRTKSTSLNLTALVPRDPDIWNTDPKYANAPPAKSPAYRPIAEVWKYSRRLPHPTDSMDEEEFGRYLMYRDEKKAEESENKKVKGKVVGGVEK